MVNYINKFLVYANKTDDNNHDDDDDDVSYTQKKKEETKIHVEKRPNEMLK
jgi:hypothetical protein